MTGSLRCWDCSGRIVEVYQPGTDIDLLVAGDTLSGGEVLPELTLAVEVVFGEQ